jgi:acyl-CoA dehydrogenase
VSDTSYLDWPFFEPRHRELVDGLEQWAQQHLGNLDHEGDVDAACRELVRELGAGGWLRYTVPAGYGGSRAGRRSGSSRAPCA